MISKERPYARLSADSHDLGTNGSTLSLDIAHLHTAPIHPVRAWTACTPAILPTAEDSTSLDVEGTLCKPTSDKVVSIKWTRSAVILPRSCAAECVSQA